MPTREQVQHAYQELGDYQAVGHALGVPAGQAYLVATGLPADGGDTLAPEEQGRPGMLPGSTQHLVYAPVPPENPAAKPEVHEWIKQQAAMDAPMQSAARAQDAAPGEPADPAATDIVVVLTRQHDQVTALLKQLKAIPGVTKGGSGVHQSRRASIVDMITVALSRHEAAEEEHFWPWVRKALADGDELAAAAASQEQHGTDILISLGTTPPSDEKFDELAEELEHAARTHVAFEDRVLLAVMQATSEKDRAAVGKRFLRAHSHAPTRPHPHAPRLPAAAVKVAGAPAAVLDQARDKAGDRPAKRRGRAEHEPQPEGNRRENADEPS